MWGTEMRIVAMTHDLSLTGAPIALYNLFSAGWLEDDLLIVSPVAGPLGTDWEEAGVRVQVGGDIDLRCCDVFVGNTLLSADMVSQFAAYGVPTVLFCHEGLFGFRFADDFPAVKEAMARARVVVYPCHWSRGLYQLLRRTRRTEVIPYGVGTPTILAREPNRDSCRCLYLGTVERRKGIDTALRAFEMLGSKYELCIAGANAESVNFWPENVHTIGIQRRDRIARLLSECDCLIMPSLDEVTPLVILEAQAASLPVIATAVGGIPEIIEAGRSGLLIQPNEPQLLAEAIRLFALDPEASTRAAQRGRANHLAHHNLTRYRSQFKELLQEVAA